MTTIEDRPVGDESDDELDPFALAEQEAAHVSIEAQMTEAQRYAGEGFWARLRRSTGEWRQIRPTPYGLIPAVLISLITLLQLFSAQVVGLAGPDIVKKLNINITAIVEITSLVSVVSVFAYIGAGWWADRHGRVPILVASATVNGLATMATGRATSAFTYGLPNTVGSVAGAGTGVPQGSLLPDYYPTEARGPVYGMLGMASSMAQLLGGPLAGAAITFLGLTTAFLIFGAPMLIVALLALIFLREPVRGYFERKALGATEEVASSEDEPASFGEAWRTIWAVRTMRRLFFAQMVIYFATAAFIFFGFYLVSEYHLDAVKRGLFLVPSALAGLLGAYFGGGLLTLYGRGRPERVMTLFGVFAIIGAVGLGLLGTGMPLAVLILDTMVYTFGFSMLGPALGVITVAVIPPSIRTQGVQMLGLAQLPYGLFGLTLFNAIRLHYGYTTTFLSAVPLIMIGSLVLISAGSFFDLDRRNAMAASLAAYEWRETKASGHSKLLVSRSVDVAYDGVQVLFGVDFDVEEGDIIALLGTNGAGKSTLLRAISGSQEASGGAVFMDGRDITHMPPAEIARRGVILMPGGRGIFPEMTVRQNLLLGAWMLTDDEDKKRRLAETYELFPILKTRAGVKAGVLSGGEQQQLSLAQAMLGKPKLLMIDELSLGLSPAVVGELVEKVREIHRRGTTIIVVEQSVNVALTIAERAIFMEKGEIRFVGKTAELLTRPDILRAVYVKGSGGSITGGRDATRRRSELDAAPTVLEVAGIEKSYGGIQALRGVDLTLARGGVLGVIGPNGSGKTTLFDIISGFQTADAGKIWLDGVDVTEMSPEERARRKLVRRFQDARLFPSLTVYETLLIALDGRLETKNLILGGIAAPNARNAERKLRVRADQLIDLLEIGAFRDKFVKELSTGLRRIVDIACVLAIGPSVLLLDEPSSGIAQAEAESLGPLLRRVRHETGCSILIIEHDMPLICRVADELVALVGGQVVARGEPDAVLNDDVVIDSYLGNNKEVIARSGGVLPT